MASDLLSTEWDSNTNRYSINWRAFWQISLVMLGLVLCVFVAIASLNNQQFESARNDAHDQYQMQLNRLIEASADKMIQLSGAVSFNNGLMHALRVHDAATYSTELESLDWNLQTDSGMQVVGLFDLDGANLYVYGENGHKASVDKVLDEESPFWLVECARECRIVTYSALLHEGEVTGVLALSEPLSNVMLRFHNVANIDTGLLHQSEDQAALSIPDWQRSLVALTNPKESRQVLSQAARDYSLEELSEGVGLVSLNNSLYELKAMPLMGNQVVVISDVSDNYTQLSQSKAETIKMSIVALVLSELFLLVFLWRPLKKIKMSEQLEGFVVRQADILKERTLALTKAQSLSENLCDTLSAAVLMLDEKGRIQLANGYFKKLMGLPSGDMFNRHISDFIQAETANFSKRLSDVQSGVIDEYEHVGIVTSSQQQSHKMIWRYVPSYFYDEENEGNRQNRSLVVIGMPIMLPTLESDQILQAFTDPQTGMLNREGLADALDKVLKKGTRAYAFSLVRVPNTCLETEQSQQMLVRVLSHFGTELGTSMTLARLDINEIGILYPVDSIENGRTVGDELIRQLINIAQTMDFDLSSSLVGSIFVDTKDRLPHQVVQRAQAACIAK